MSENKVSLSETRPVFYFTSVIFVVLYSGHNATREELYAAHRRMKFKYLQLPLHGMHFLARSLFVLISKQT